MDAQYLLVQYLANVDFVYGEGVGLVNIIGAY